MPTDKYYGRNGQLALIRKKPNTLIPIFKMLADNCSVILSISTDWVLQMDLPAMQIIGWKMALLRLDGTI